MELSDFMVGESFYTASGTWIIADVGTRWVIAFKVKPFQKNVADDERDNIVFYEYDFAGCSLTPER
jgi:hypothetical protein